MDGETAGGGGCHGVVGGLEPIHAGSPVRETTADGEDEIDGPDPLGGGSEAGVHLGLDRSGSLGGKHLDATADERRQDGDGEEDDSQTANPLHERAPEEDAVGQTLYVVEDGGTGSGKARHGLEESVSKVADAAVDEEREHAEDGKDNPRPPARLFQLPAFMYS